MKRHTLVLCCMALATAACQAATRPSIQSFMGGWTITKVMGYADMSGGAPLGKELIGKTLLIASNKITLSLDNVACVPNDGYRVREVDTEVYLEQDAGAAIEDAKLPPKAFMLDTGNCTKPFWIDEDHIEFDFLGVFVIAERVATKGR